MQHCGKLLTKLCQRQSANPDKGNDSEKQLFSRNLSAYC